MYYFRIGISGAGLGIPVGGGMSLPLSSSNIVVGTRVGTTGAGGVWLYSGRSLSGMAGAGAAISDWIESPFGGQVFRSLDGKRFRVKLYGVAAGRDLIDTEAWVYTTGQRPVQVLSRRGIRYSGALLSTVDVTVELQRTVVARLLSEPEGPDDYFDSALESHRRRTAG